MAVSRRQFLEYARRNRLIDDSFAKAFDELWGRIDHTSFETAKADLQKYLPALAEKFGKASAVNAAEFYDTARSAGGVRGAYEATVAEGELWKVGVAIDHAFGDDFVGNSVRDFVLSIAESVVRDYGRQTIAENSDNDDQCAGYNSFPTGDDPCVFCIVKALGSYKKYAGEVLTEGINEDAWHPNCTCELVPTFDETPGWMLGRYDEYKEMYDAGVRQAREDTEDLRNERYEKLMANPRHQFAKKNQLPGVGRKEWNAKNALDAKWVMAGMRKANGIGH